jgi:hypothetical protein
MDNFQQTIVMILLALISGALPFLERIFQNRRNKIKAECLLIANEFEWISVEEIAIHVGTSIKTAKKNIEWGIKERIILGNFENNMFERTSQRNPKDIAYFIPE